MKRKGYLREVAWGQGVYENQRCLTLTWTEQRIDSDFSFWVSAPYVISLRGKQKAEREAWSDLRQDHVYSWWEDNFVMHVYRWPQ